MKRAAVGIAIVVLLVACGSDNVVRGVVIDVTGDLEDVTSFTLRADGGEIIELVPDPDGAFAFPLTHLQEHRQSLTPVAVTFEERDGVKVAVAIADADGDQH